MGASSPKDRAVRLTRDFAVVALVVSVIAAVSVSHLAREMTAEQINRLTEKSNADLSQTIANDLWPLHTAFMDTVPWLSAEDIRLHGDTVDLATHINELVAGTRVLKVKLYDLTGVTAFSTEAEQIGKSALTNERYVTARQGDIASILEFRETFNAVAGAVEDRWVLSSYIPIRPGRQGEIQGVAEIYSDVTDVYLQSQVFARQLTMIVIAAFLAVFLVLLTLVLRADRLIKSNHDRTVRMASAIATAEAEVQAKSDFLANMSHELRTPLNAILGFSEVMRKETFGPLGSDRYHEYMGDIHTSGSHLRDIINLVLDMAKIEAGKMDLDCEAVDLGELCDDVVRMAQGAADAGGVRLVLERRDDGGTIETDPGKVRQILLNLVSNAVKFTEPGGTVTVAVANRPQPEITVTDTGVGMREEDIPIALAPFSQVDTSLTREHEGTGLGLSISQSLAHLLGGSLQFSSEPGVGTEVTLQLLDQPTLVQAHIA